VDGAASRPGPGGRSRLREATAAVLTALAQAEPTLAELPGLFITPYAAQAAAAAGWLRAAGLARFRTSTVHAQQGAEADVVVFDTVHASSTGWPPDEWVRLVNVGLSRARELVILLATRDEVSQPWMRPLRPHLAPRALHRHGEGWAWREVDGVQRAQSSLFGAPVAAAPEAPPLPEGEGMGAQIARRRALRPILSRDQRRLVDRDLADAGPRLVRGVAGSGKTLVLAHWVVRTLMGQGFERVVILYGNRALDKLLRAMLDEAWVARQEGVPRAVPWERIRLLHVADLLADLRLERGLPPPADRYDYEAQAAAILADGPVAPRFEALFVDEAQDLGHDALRLAVDLVRPHHGRKPVLVFYDNAQNVYGRRAPVWAELGLDMRGRSDVMEEGFRNGRQIVEAALNLVHRLTGDLLRDPDLRELHRRGLIAASQRRWEPWWEARFCPDDGEEPAVYVFEDEAAERAFVARRVRELIDEGVRPGDLRVVCLSADQRRAVVEALRAAVPEVAVREVRQEGFVGLDDVIAVTTPHSIKGYDAEVVLVLGADRFVARGEALVSTLYVAMTRARTLLVLTAVRREGQPEEGLRIAEAVAELRDLLAYRVESDRFERPL
jgi:hypothetical protein